VVIFKLKINFLPDDFFFQENTEFVTEYSFFNKYFSQNDENSLLKKKVTNA
jgi:hypothetical protein